MRAHSADHEQPKQWFTKLKDRVLWFDGTSTVEPDRLIHLITTSATTNGWFVTELNNDIKQYNKHADPDKRIEVKGHAFEHHLNFVIPQEYLDLDVVAYLKEKLTDQLTDFELVEQRIRINRTFHEVELYKKLGLMDVLRALIYIINTLQTHNVVWGVGRGSSVASYVLYLIGVHDVDSVEYQLDVSEFLRPETTGLEKHNG